MWTVDAIYEHSEVFTRGKLTDDMEDMSIGASGVDRLLPDIFGGIPWHLALHVDDHRRGDWQA